VDGSLLGVAAIPCRDRAGRPYEVTLRLARDRRPFGTVGQRCGHQLATLAAQARAARDDPEQAACWPDPDDRFPVPAGATVPARMPPSARTPIATKLAAFQPDEREYFTLRSRERGDLPGDAEVRCVLRSSADWRSGAEAGDKLRPGYWRLRRRCVLEAWGESGTGVRAVLTSAELVTFLDTVLGEPDGTVDGCSAPASGRAGEQPRRRGWPTWR